ncbi:MAG: penicillin-binding transpeptidase domain-containing protein [Oscillospiraceae bacterium]|nr:penicillin-binding transpeptidase domain-containing protein [Oscillospiraceae bacterium]
MANHSEHSPKRKPLSMMARLVLLVCPVLLIGLGWVLYNLFKWSVLEGDVMKARAANQQLSDVEIPANRGTIYDSNMNILAQSATVWNVVIDPAAIQRQLEDDHPDSVTAQDRARNEMAAKLAELLDVTQESVLSHISHTDKNYRCIAEKVEKPVIDELLTLIKEEKYGGISTEVNTKRYYPYGNLACHVIGFTTRDNQGAYGLEAKYNSVLSGTPGRKITAKDALGDALPTTYEKSYEATEGNSIVTTIDQMIQHYIEKNLDATMAQYNPDQGAAIIVMDVNTGGILGMASRPDYDLNNPQYIYDDDTRVLLESIADEEERKEALSTARENQWRNKTITDTYEPGSVFKTVTASAALEEGTATLNSTYYCGGAVQFPGLDKPIKCHKTSGHGLLDFTGALVNSCNPAFIAIGQSLGQERFFKYYEAFGLTEKTGIDLPAENIGSYYDASMSDISLASCSFGQSNTVTPLQMLTAAVATINGGYLLTPHIVDRVVDSNGNTVEEYGTQVRRQVISEETSVIMRSALEQVVSHNGGTNAYVKGYRIGGKSGTAQKLTDTTDTKRVFSYFVFAPADDPQVAALVLVDEPTEGDTSYANVVVGPLASAVMKDILPYLGILPTYSEEELADQEVSVPSGLYGLDPATATSKLGIRGLNGYVVGNGKEVVGVYPDQGTRVPQESTIVLYTESGEPSMVTVPSVVGMTPSQANKTLGSVGLNIRISGGAANNKRSRVASQDVEAGTEVQRGTLVTVECLISGEDGE